MRRWRPAALLAVFLLAGVCEAQIAQDRVRIRNGGGGQKGVLVDGVRGGVHRNDAAYRSPRLGSIYSSLFPVVALDDFTLSAQSNEVIAFAPSHPPALRQNVVWSGGANTVDITFEDAYRIAVFVWIVVPPFDAGRELAVEHSIVTSRLWSQERQGVAFDRFVVRDATGVDGFDAVDCADAPTLRSAAGAEPGAINVYYVDQVVIDGTNTRFGAWFCGFGYTILMSSQAAAEVLAHEFGHAFDLDHVDTDLAWFDTTNLMHSRSDDRRYLTEGQTFRAVHNPASALNNVYDVRFGQSERSCPHSLSSTNDACPGVQKRIWADGAWDAN